MLSFLCFWKSFRFERGIRCVVFGYIVEHEIIFKTLENGNQNFNEIFI